MSISLARLTNAKCAYYEQGPSESTRTVVERILERDDEWRATHQPAAPGTEPELPEGVTFTDEGGTDGSYYRKPDPGLKSDFEGSIYINKQWSPAELRQIALHTDYRDRQRTREQEAKPAVTDAMVNAALQVVADYEMDHTEQRKMRACIAAALEAQRSEARKS